VNSTRARVRGNNVCPKKKGGCFLAKRLRREETRFGRGKRKKRALHFEKGGKKEFFSPASRVRGGRDELPAHKRKKDCDDFRKKKKEKEGGSTFVVVPVGRRGKRPPRPCGEKRRFLRRKKKKKKIDPAGIKGGRGGRKMHVWVDCRKKEGGGSFLFDQKGKGGPEGSRAEGNLVAPG